MLYGLGDGPEIELVAALRHYPEHSRAEVRGIVLSYFDWLDSLEPVSREVPQNSAKHARPPIIMSSGRRSQSRAATFAKACRRREQCSVQDQVEKVALISHCIGVDRDAAGSLLADPTLPMERAACRSAAAR